MKIIPLSEGTFTIDQSKKFLPFDLDNDVLTDRPQGSLLVEVQPFVVVTSKDILLLDTGLGFEINGKMQIHKNLIDGGINPSEVTKVLLSHLHKDHGGGVGYERDGLGARLSFENASYFVQQKEFQYAFEKGFPSYTTQELEALKENEKVHLLDGDGVIDDYISYKVSGAHAPFHQVFWIRDEGDIVFYGGDEAPQLKQMKHRFVAKYDYDGKKAMELRTAWWQQGMNEGWTFLFYHDVRNPLYECKKPDNAGL
ncbi:MAG TPA: MBL fold metallo-hydrolase [Chitinophagaceae bacterium]|nr:MBL fold metallo-hydrolase [Chitinophagaceae bacterium]